MTLLKLSPSLGVNKAKMASKVLISPETKNGA